MNDIEGCVIETFGGGRSFVVHENIEYLPHGSRLIYTAPGLQIYVAGIQGNLKDTFRVTAMNLCIARNIPLSALSDVSGYAGRAKRVTPRSDNQLLLPGMGDDE